MKETFKEFTVTVNHAQEKESPWGADLFQHNRVTVKSGKTGKRTSFDFWGSRVEPTPKDRYDVLNAFYCFVSDALSGGEYEFPEFCKEFGYDVDNIDKAWGAWKGCKRSFDKLSRMSGYSMDELYDLCNELAEDYA